MVEQKITSHSPSLGKQEGHRHRLWHRQSDSVYFNSWICDYWARRVTRMLTKGELALQNAFSLLKSNGVLVVTAPAFMFLYGQHDMSVGHQRRYTFRSLTSKLSSAGFVVEFQRYWNVPGMFGWLLASRLLGSSPNKLSFPFVREIYDRWLRMEDRLRFPFGLTIVAKARKPCSGRT